MKTELQLLRFNEDIQNHVLGTLKYLHGNDFELGKISDYKDFGSKIKSGYWKERGQLVIQGGCDYSNVPNQGQSGDDRMRLYAIMKLESYGFHRTHCNEVLDALDDNIDDSINLLYDKYFPGPRKKSEETVSVDLSSEELLEIRSDEKEALESIYDKLFYEIEKNHIWQLKMRLDYLLEFSPSEQKKLEKRKQLEEEEKLRQMLQLKQKKKTKLEKCRNMVEKGKCRFGKNCRFSHNIYGDDLEDEDGNPKNSRKLQNNLNDEDDEKTWYLEVRFPHWCKYPYQPPIILLRNKIADIPKSICLRINQKLINLSRELACDGVPSVYSLIECLQTNDEILSYLSKNVNFRYPNPEQSIFDYDPYEDGCYSDEETEKNLPTHYKQGKINKFDKRNLSDQQILQENLQIIKKFQNKLQNDSYFKQMLKVRQELPAFAKRKEILEAVHGNQIIIICGETGCGKSTQIPQFLLDDWLENSARSKEFGNIDIVCTQPRRISAIGVAERVSEERNEKVS